MLYDPGGTCTVLAYRPAHYCLRPKVEYRLPLVVLSRLNRFTLSHYGSRTPLSTLHAGLTASHARLSTGCLLGFSGSGLSPDYTIHAELAHTLRTLGAQPRQPSRPQGVSHSPFFKIPLPLKAKSFIITMIYYCFQREAEIKEIFGRMRARGLLFGVAVAFSVWNIITNGVNVRTVAICAMILVCLVINIYNYRQKQQQRAAAEEAVREKEEVRQLRAEARRRQNRRNRKHRK